MFPFTYLDIIISNQSFQFLKNMIIHIIDIYSAKREVVTLNQGRVALVLIMHLYC